MIIINQYFTATEAAARPEAQARLRMLVVAPDPLGKPLSPLNIAAEWTALSALIQRSDHPVALVRLNPPAFEYLQEAVADRRHPYDVIHFIAHGDGRNLALEKADGGVDWRTYAEIAEQHGPYTREEWRAARRKHAEHFLAFAQEHRKVYRALELEFDNPCAALAFATSQKTRDDNLARSLVWAVDFFLDKRGYWDENIQWWQEYREASQRLGDRAVLATSLHNMGFVALAHDDLARALALFTRSRGVFTEIGLEEVVAREEEMMEEVRRRMGRGDLSADE